MPEFLSKEWLAANLFSAETMPDDHRFEITGKEWNALLMEINMLRSQPTLWKEPEPCGSNAGSLEKEL